MSYTREDWCIALLNAIGNTNPQQEVIDFLVGWTDIETSSPPGAQYNLLNTTEEYTPGVVSNFNSAGVKNYDTFAHGIQANAKVLNNGLYGQLLESLRMNAISTLRYGVDINSELAKWGTGRVQNTIVSLAGKNALEMFQGTGPTERIFPMDPQKEFKAVVPDVNDTLGIGQAWYADHAKGIDHGPALTREYYDEKYAYQNFAGALAIWEKATGKLTWQRYS